MRPASGDTPKRDLAPPATSASSPEPSRPAVGERPWVELLRAERWQEGLSLLDAEVAAVREAPLTRYAAAAAAAHIGDSERTLNLLAGLELRLPLLAESVRARRAEAAFHSGNLRVALEFFAGRSDPLSRLRTAEAHFRLGEHKQAQLALDGLLRKIPRRNALCSLEAPARRLLSELLPAEPAALRAREQRWLATRAALCESARGADERLESLPLPLRLSESERLTRAQAFAEAGQLEAVEREISALLALPRPSLELGTPDYLRGYARYQARTELDRASTLLASAAASNGNRAAEWLFFSGRARERAGQTALAVELYERVAKRYPKSAFADHAVYRMAQLAYSGGRFELAAKAYDAYLARFGARARFAADARDERAVAWLASGHAADAARAFHGLAEQSSEPRVRARYVQLEALALLRSGKLEPARALWREVIREHPLTFAALCAAARLQATGESPPPALPTATASAQAQAPLNLALPPAAELLHGAGLDREAEGALGEVEQSVGRAYPGRGDEALCGLYGRLAPAERAYRTGQRAASTDELSRAPLLGRRWLWDCVYPRPYKALVAGLAAEQGLEAELVYAVMRQESAFRPDALSPVKASGLLQLMPSTALRVARELGLELDPARLREPPLNVRLGARYLRKVLDWFGGNTALAAASYNAGPIAVQRWLENSTALELDVFVARIPYEETRSYVERVVGNHARYRYLAGGEAAVPKLDLVLPAHNLSGQDLY
jgi:soluble lytic murein transglycosylase